MSPPVSVPTPATAAQWAASQRNFGGTFRVFNFAADGYRWHIQYRHMNEGGIHFPDAAQLERWQSLTDAQRAKVAEGLLALVEPADRERIQHRVRLQHLQAGLRQVLKPRKDTAPAPPPEPRTATPATRERGPRSQRRQASTGARGDPDPSSEPPLASPSRPSRLAAASVRMEAHLARRRRRRIQRLRELLA